MNNKFTTVLIAVIVLVIIVVGVYYFVSKSTYQSPTTSTNNSVNASVPLNDNKITIANFSFTPAALTIKVGSTVTWTNNDSATHTVVSDTFSSGNLPTGQTFTHTFDAPGTFGYHCGPHPSMVGQIIVTQ